MHTLKAPTDTYDAALLDIDRPQKDNPHKKIREKVSVADWVREYRQVRRQTEILCRPLQEEDFNLQAMAEVSPPKWHLAHTTWFFEILWLQEFSTHYIEYNPSFTSLFNSYYQSLGQPFPRDRRGLLSRPSLEEVVAYRHEIDKRVENQLKNLPVNKQHAALQRLQLGLHHEQQHQELLLMDIKYNFSVNPLLPSYLVDETFDAQEVRGGAAKISWCEFAGGIVSIGADAAPDGDDASAHDLGFSDLRFEDFRFDNETPCHREFLSPYALADRPVNNGDFLNFIEDGGYHRPELWLSDGWTRVQQQHWQAPLYWFAPGQLSGPAMAGRSRDHRWQIFTLYGLKPLRVTDPVCHISYYEAEAFARWAGARLPTEAEWENAAAQHQFEGHFIDDGVLHPRAPCPALSTPCQMFGDVWEWTASSYAPYPGYRACAGAVGEYNGKFMCNQMVLRGGSCVSERAHLRSSYRNFFYPWDRWQFSGLRLARIL